jgi:hypothetical protein
LALPLNNTPPPAKPVAILTDSAPKSTHQPVQPLGGTYYDLISYLFMNNQYADKNNSAIKYVVTEP